MIKISKMSTKVAIIAAVATAAAMPSFAGEVRVHHHHYHGVPATHRGSAFVYAAPSSAPPSAYTSPLAPSVPRQGEPNYRMHHDWQTYHHAY